MGILIAPLSPLRNQEAQLRDRLNRSQLEPTRGRCELEPQSANFYDYERYVVGKGTVTPCSNDVENCPLHTREC